MITVSLGPCPACSGQALTKYLVVEDESANEDSVSVRMCERVGIILGCIM